MPRLLPFIAVATVAAFPSAAWAQDSLDASAEMPDRIINLMVYGDDACPEPESPDEMVVCGRQPESERYRIPRRFRDRGDRLMETSWGARVMELDEAQRFTRPNSCSVDGSWGQTGCTQAMIRQWYAERREAAREAERNR